ncbi:MAG: penicillin-binding protein 2 [Acidobacteriaceae bacterium]
MMNPFEYSGTKRRTRQSLELGIEETIQGEDAGHGSLDDERMLINSRRVIALLLLAFFVLLGRIYFLQIGRGEMYRGIAEGNKSRIQYLLAPRGLILDSQGKVIAGNIPSFELVAIPADLPKEEGDLRTKIGQLAVITGKDPQEFLDKIAKMDRKTFMAQTLAENLPKDQALTIIGKGVEFTGFAVQNNAIRDYKDPLVFSHLVGYTGKINDDEMKEVAGKNYLLNDYIGKTGLEQVYEDYLRGTPGQKPSEIDAQGKFKKNLPEIPAIPGKNIKLNIDYDLQKVLYDSLMKVMDKYKKTKAAAVATNPKTGQVLAFISLPGFDTNQFARGISQDEYKALSEDKSIPMLNRAISGTYPPGSTVKPMLAIAGLTEGVITPTTKILDDGVIRVGSFSFYGYARGGLGLMDVYSAIARSSDIFFYTVGGGSAKSVVKDGLGPERLAEWYRKFHLGSTLGIDLPQEKPGLVPDPDWKKKTTGEGWYLGNTYHISIGQGDLLVTPLQVNSWTATIANGGKIMQPRILDEVSDSSGKVYLKSEPKVLQENFLDPKWVKVVQDGMRQTVTAGSAPSLKTLPIPVSGKTGTAQFLNKNLTATHAWFTSYAPSDDPQIALTVMVEEGGEGSTVSVPVARDVYAWWAENRYKK